MESMTGYYFSEKSSGQFTFSVELKSLNNRYLETYVNVPRILRSEENELHGILKNSFERGKLEMNIDIYDWIETRPISLNSDLIKKYFRELSKVKWELGVNEPVDIEAILNLDGVSQRERSVISEKSLKEIYRSVNQAINKTISMRRKEGAVIKKDLNATVKHISSLMSQIKSLSERVVEDKKEQLVKRIHSLNRAVDDNRLYTEVAILADKLDVNEEIVRMNDHIKKFGTLVKSEEQSGKKLDFLAQEMFREINTIGSKSNDSRVSHMVVEVKNHIDKIREHCRNIV